MSDLYHLKTQTFLYPTDTTFGLGCDAFNPELVNEIAKLKGRPTEKSFIVLVSSASQLLDMVSVPDMAWELINISDKPVTIIYDQPTEKVPEHLLTNDGTIAIRLTDDPLSKKIIQKIKNPIISTSANLSGEEGPKNYKSISPSILENVDFIFPETISFEPKFIHSSIIKIGDGGLVKVIRT